MRKHLTLVLLSLGAIAPCGAGIVTVDPLSHPSGTDISSAYTGLVMHVQSSTPGTTTYTPITSPVLAANCTYSVCLGNGPFGSIGGTTGNGLEEENCFDRTHAGLTTRDCGAFWKVLELNFPGGTDFVQINALWIIDSPHLIAYDSAGNKLFYCKTSGFGAGPPMPGSQPGCVSNQNVDTDGYMGVLKLQSASPVISRVVFASMLGSSVATRIQYNWINPKCVCKCPKLVASAKDEEQRAD